MHVGCLMTNIVYIYIYIYCHPQTNYFVLSELFSEARHIGRSKPESKLIQLYVTLSLRPTSVQRGLRYFFKVLCSKSRSCSVRSFTFFIPYRLPECSILSKSFACVCVCDLRGNCL